MSTMSLWAGAAGAQPSASLDATVMAGGGYDSNALLEIRPQNVKVRARGFFAGVEPEFGLSLKRGNTRIYARANALLRQSPQFGFVAWNTADAGVAYLKNTTHIAGALTASHFTASQFADESLWGWGPQFVLSTALSERWRVLATTLTQWRSTQDVTQRFDAAALALRFSASSVWQWGTRASWMSLASGPAAFDRPWSRLRVGPYVQTALLANRFIVQADPFIGWRQLQGFHAQQFGAVVSLQTQLPAGFGLLARLDWTYETGPEEAGRGDRSELWLALTWRPVGRQPQPGASSARASRPHFAPQVKGQRVLFRYPAKGASEVRLMGSFDNWAVGLPLEPGPGGVWQAWLTVASGRVRYHFLVDGVPSKPLDSPRYIADGFGGVDGEIDVGTPPLTDPHVSP